MRRLDGVFLLWDFVLDREEAKLMIRRHSGHGISWDSLPIL